MKTLIAALLSVTLLGCVTVSPTYKAMHSLSARAAVGHLPPTHEVFGDSHVKNLDHLTEWLKRRWVRLGFVPAIIGDDGQDRMGQTMILESGAVFILVNNATSKNNQFYTLLHEVAHVYQARNLSVAAGEVFAEIVSSQVCKRLGLDVSDQTTKYLDAIPVAFQWKAVDLFHKEADAVVLMLVGASKGDN